MTFLNFWGRNLQFLSSIKKAVSSAVWCNVGCHAAIRSAAHSSAWPHPQQQVLQERTSEEEQITKDILNNVNKEIRNKDYGRLFAVVYVSGKQYLVTQDDLLVIKDYWPPTIGDVIRLEKVLCVGGRDLTLVGRPLLHRDLVNVEATVVEKTLANTRVKLTYTPRRNNRRRRFNRATLTMLRINQVEIQLPLDKLPSVEGVEGRVF